MVLLFLWILLVPVIVLVFWVRRSHSYWQRRGVWTLPTKFLYGNAKNVVFQKEWLAENLQKFYNRCKHEGKQFGGYYLFAKPVLVPVDIDMVKRIYTTDFKYFADHFMQLDNKNDPLSLHLLNMKGERWSALRSLLSPIFSHGSVRKFSEITLKRAQGLRALVEEMVGSANGIDVKEMVERYMIDNTIAFVYGIESNFLMDADSVFKKYAELVFGVGFKQSLRFLVAMVFPEFYSIFKLRSYDGEVTKFFSDLVLKLQYRKSGGGEHKALLNKLLEDKFNKKNDLSTEEVIGQCFGIFLAGTETSSSLIAFTLFELASNAEIQEKARAEITNAINNHGSITYELVNELEYTKQCISETMRKYSPAPFNTRVCTETYQIPNSSVTIEKGTQVFIPHHAIHMDPEYFPDPDNYDPDRFSEENTENNTSVFIPFGLGQRKCPGFQFGTFHIAVALGVLLSNFRFTVHPASKEPWKFSPLGYFALPDPPLRLIAERL